MEIEISKRVASIWRSFFGSEEGQQGLAWILSQRPTLTPDSWQKAAGFEEFHKKIIEILDTERPVKRDRSTDPDELK